jgi:hypothetical protein
MATRDRRRRRDRDDDDDDRPRRRRKAREREFTEEPGWGSAFERDVEKGSNQPEWTGQILDLDGNELQVAVWERTSRSGDVDYLRIHIQEPLDDDDDDEEEEEEERPRRRSKPKKEKRRPRARDRDNYTDDDDLPF